MAFQPSTQTRVIGGDFALSTYTVNVNVGWTENMLDTTALTDTSKQFIPGQDTSTFHVHGILDVIGTSPTTLFDHVQNAWQTTADVPFSVAPRGYAFGNEVIFLTGNETASNVSANVKDKALFSLDGQTDGYTDVGFSYHDLSAETATNNSTFNDGAASSSNGGAGFLHVTAYSGFTNVVAVIQDATTSGGVYATILTFATVTATTSQRLAITGTVRQFTRCLWTVTGSGSITFAAGFARR